MDYNVIVLNYGIRTFLSFLRNGKKLINKFITMKNIKHLLASVFFIALFFGSANVLSAASICDGVVCDTPGPCQIEPGVCKVVSDVDFVCIYHDDPVPCNLDADVCTVDRCLSDDGGESSQCLPGPNACGGIIPCGRLIDDPSTTGIHEDQPCTLCSMILMAQLIVEFLVKMAAIIALLAIAAGGLLYMSALGNQANVGKAKSIIKDTLIGFIVVFIAWAVIDSILMSMGYIDPVGGEWYIMEC